MADANDIIPPLVAAIFLLFITASRFPNIRFKIGKFEFGKENDKLDNQIDDIATIVKEQKQESKSTAAKIISEITTLAVGQTAQFIPDVRPIVDMITRLLEKKENPTWSLVEGLINNYHKQALRQASIQFWFSLAAAVVGFAFAIHGLTSGGTVTDKAIGTLPGIVIDLVAALFFKQAEQTRQRATELYDRLRTDNERTVAIDLINSIDDGPLRSIVKAQLALKIGGVDTALTDLSLIVQKPST